MVKILEINGLNYGKIKNMTFSFEKGLFYTAVGSNNSGKTTLFRILSGFIPTKNMIICDKLYLNNNRFSYIKKVGVVKRVDRKSFLFQNVYDELFFPLKNIGCSKKDSMIIIKKTLHLFNIDDILNMPINKLSMLEKQKLLFALALLHSPKVLLIDDALAFLKPKEQVEIFNILNNLKSKGLTIIYFSINLNSYLYADRMIIISDYKIIKEMKREDLFENEKLLIDNNIELPFICDLSNKLRIYNLIDKNYLNMNELVNDIWP